MWDIVAMGVFNMYQSHQANKANNALSEQNRDNAVVSQTYENRGLNEQHREQSEIDADRKMEALKQALKAKGTIQAKTTNVSGATDGVSQEISNNLGALFGQLNANASGRSRQLASSKLSTTASAQSRINASPKTRFNPLTEVAKTGLSIYGGYKGAKYTAKKDGVNPDLSLTDYMKGDWL